MRITPLDVRKQEFRSAMRGLDRDEVHAFLATVADEYEAVLTDNKQLREKVIELDEKVSEYRNMERTLRDTLITAERVMTEARQNARKESELILRDAELKAQQQTAHIAAQVEALRNQVRELRGHRDSYIARLHSLSEAQIGLLESYRRDFQNEDRSTQKLLGSSHDEAKPETAKAPPVPETAPAPSPAPPRAAAPPPAESTPPAAPTPKAEAPAPADDQWRSYSVGAGSAMAMAPQAPTPAPPVETRVDDLHAATPQWLEEQATPAAEPAPEAVTNGAPEIELEPARSELAFQFADEAATEAAESSANEDEALDQVARAYHESTYEEPVAEAPASEWTPVGGHSDDPVAPYGASPGFEPEASAFDENAEEVEAAEENGGSRWSLSRFTRGLGNF